MRTIDRESSALVMVDFQARLMPAIEDSTAAVANARRLLDAAALLDVPVLFTEQNPRGLGATVPELAQARAEGAVLHKMTFDACRAGGRLDWLPNRPSLVVTGCEAHVCVLQTVLGLLDAGRRVYVVQDAIGSRRAESKAAALQRMARHGAEIVTAEMVIFEWLVTAEHPRFREVVALVK
ncbi:MAG: isochorismatase family protein [Chloroflexales bacterium]|nr:isochorismatase family protein [Chloroflexales bacterium]